MTVPAIVQERLGDEAVTARVPLSGDDELFVTPVRSLIYRAEGLLSGESVEVYPHEAERVAVNEGRRKCTITPDHGLDGESQFSVPADRYDQAIEPILGGVFTAAGITEPEETIEEVYRLGELSIVITDARVIKHVGNALWDEEFEEYPFDAVTGIDVEEGSVSSQIIVEVDGRPQRIKTPTDDARRIRSKIQEGVLAYQGFATYEEFREKVELEAELDAEAVEAAPQAEATEAPSTEGAPSPEPESTVEPTAAEPSPESEASEPDLGSGMVFGEADDQLTEDGDSAEPDEVAEELAQLKLAVERQKDLRRRRQQAIEELPRELDRDE
jgi:hypothetical protein